MIKDRIEAREQRRWRAHGLLGIAVLAAIALGVYPQLGALLPACPIHEYFGILCPGCGGSRAVVALLHGRVAEAVRMNGLVVALAPFALLFTGASYRRALKPGTFYWPKMPVTVVYGLGVMAVVFAVFRNLA